MHSTISVAAAALFLANTAYSAPAAASSYSIVTPNSSNSPWGSAATSSVAAPSSSNSTWGSAATSSVAVASSSIAAASSSTTVSSCPTSTPDAALYASLVLAPNAVARQALLTDDQFVFDFTDPCLTTTAQGVVAGDGGKTVRADHLTFPALTSNGGSITMGFLGPCGFNTPHVHPRAAEMNVVVEGRLFASVTAENGARHMNHTLNKFEMTVFPAGAIHTEFNPDCTPATFVAAFPNEDPGVGQIAQEYIGLEDEIVQASLGGEVTVNGLDIDQFRNLLPHNVVKGVESCLAQCGMTKRSLQV